VFFALRTSFGSATSCGVHVDVKHRARRRQEWVARIGIEVVGERALLHENNRLSHDRVARALIS
jgi:hypothetical protein